MDHMAWTTENEARILVLCQLCPLHWLLLAHVVKIRWCLLSDWLFHHTVSQCEKDGDEGRRRGKVKGVYLNGTKHKRQKEMDRKGSKLGKESGGETQGGG